MDATVVLVRKQLGAILGPTRMGKLVKAFFHGVVRGVGAPSDTFIVNTYSYPHASEEEAMRSDWVRVGEGLKGSMKRLEKQVDVKAAA